MRFGTFREPALVLLWTVISCGLYYFYFVYKVSQEIEDFQGQADYAPGIEVLLSVATCGLWIYYWDYRVGKRMAEMASSVGLPATDNSLLYVLLNLLGHPIIGIGAVNSMIQQDMLNRIWSAAQSQRL